MTTNVANAANLAQRFQNKTALENAILRQTISAGNVEVAKRLAEVAEVQTYEQGEVLIRQGDTDTHFFLILAGSVVVSPNGRDDTVRRAHSHVGEMATIDPAVRRSATVRAGESTVVAKLSEPEFTEVANSYPFLWRRIALELAERLRQRTDGVMIRAETPRVLIASSSEALEIAGALKSDLMGHNVDVKIWTDGIFVPGATNIEALEQELKIADFAAIILSDDDKVFSRWRLARAPRDNLVLELGLFMGAIGRQRAIMIHPKNRKVKLPTDLLGLTPISYVKTDMTAAAKTMLSLVTTLGPK